MVHLVRPGRAARHAAGIPIDVLDKRKRHRGHRIDQHRIAVTERVDSSSELAALADPKEIAVGYDAVVATGRQLGVPMPVMASFEADIRRFARTGPEPPKP